MFRGAWKSLVIDPSHDDMTYVLDFITFMEAVNSLSTQNSLGRPQISHDPRLVLKIIQTICETSNKHLQVMSFVFRPYVSLAGTLTVKYYDLVLKTRIIGLQALRIFLPMHRSHQLQKQISFPRVSFYCNLNLIGTSGPTMDRMLWLKLWNTTAARTTLIILWQGFEIGIILYEGLFQLVKSRGTYGGYPLCCHWISLPV